MKEKHNQTLELSTRQKTKCIHPSCEETSFHHNKLLDHLEQAHTADIQLSRLHFMSMKEFFTWTEAEETKNYIYYSKHTSAKKGKSASYLYYHCQKDGHSKPHRCKGEEQRKKAERNKKGVIKKDMLCPSGIICKIDLSGAINVTYIQSHNHPIQFKDTEHQPMPKSALANVKSMLIMGASVDNIHKDLRGGKDSRDNRTDSNNLQRKHAV